MLPPPFPDSGILRDPVAHAALIEKDGQLWRPGGEPVRFVDGFPDLRPPGSPFRHRFWGWVYNLTAFGYDFGVRLGWRLSLGGAPIEREAYLSRLAVGPGMRVLETAVGTGANLFSLDHEAEIYGFDRSAAMLRRCRSRLAAAGRSAGLVLADLSAAPFLDAVFDLVLHMGGLQFTQNPRRCIAEMHRMVAPGGRALVVEERASAPAMVRRSGAGDLAGLVPAAAKDVRIETISGGELVAIEFRK